MDLSPLSDLSAIIIARRKISVKQQIRKNKYNGKDRPKRAVATELVSRVLCIPSGIPQSSIFTTRYRIVQGYAPATHRIPTDSRSKKALLSGVASDRVYMAYPVTGVSVSSYLAFPSLPHKRRFISVALSRGSPQADVIRYPCPVKPGLSSQ